MLNICILEDGRNAAEQLKQLAENHPQADQFAITHFASSRELDKFMSTGQPIHILLADIILPGEPTGIQTVKQRFPEKSGTQVIYVSGYLQTAPDVYETDHVYFLLKPVSQNKFNAAMDRALENLKEASVAQHMIAVKTKGKRVALAPERICYIESDLRQLHIHTVDETIDVYLKLSEMSEKLPKTFVRCHRSFVVNVAKVASFTREAITLTDGQVVPISKSRCKETQLALLRHFC